MQITIPCIADPLLGTASGGDVSSSKAKNSLRTLRKYTDEIVRYEVAPIIIVRMASTFPFSQGTII